MFVPSGLTEKPYKVDASSPSKASSIRASAAVSASSIFAAVSNVTATQAYRSSARCSNGAAGIGPGGASHRRQKRDAADRQRLVKLESGDRDQYLKHLGGQIIDALDPQAVVSIASVAR